ncbi:7-carboxy-7-deazaguanine synthase QueE [Streptomyces alanosinicus]|uniref:7-carboxy-7-deazaguanine synthase n=1 Tax=Streptomyces alanosinicus TaxID=68171 RepID=A0A918YQ69_9ACTN|nr:7-carboxy-7-deazaguanine synthase QueE [Streptomyces alanosinicus]GHE11340.1 radical SAM protein [Streptomyces alanosinicus]
MTRRALPLLAADRNRDTHLPVNEVFWDVIQGEGPYMGRSCGFIRLGLCNLHCPPCDTAQTWDRSRYDLAATCPDTAVEVAVNQLPRRVRMVVISGGEPLLWQSAPAFITMLDLLGRRGIEVHVETNGTIAPLPSLNPFVGHYSVSPKLTVMGGGDPLKRRIQPDTIAAFAQLAAAERAVFKFVVADQVQIGEVADFVAEHALEPSWVWVMPEASDAATLLERQPVITAGAAEYGYNVSTRLHLIARCR